MPKKGQVINNNNITEKEIDDEFKVLVFPIYGQKYYGAFLLKCSFPRNNC